MTTRRRISRKTELETLRADVERLTTAVRIYRSTLAVMVMRSGGHVEVTNDETQGLEGSQLLTRPTPSGGIEMMVETSHVYTSPKLVGPDGRVLVQ